MSRPATKKEYTEDILESNDPEKMREVLFLTSQPDAFTQSDTAIISQWQAMSETDRENLTVKAWTLKHKDAYFLPWSISRGAKQAAKERGDDDGYKRTLDQMAQWIERAQQAQPEIDRVKRKEGRNLDALDPGFSAWYFSEIEDEAAGMHERKLWRGGNLETTTRKILEKIDVNLLKKDYSGATLAAAEIAFRNIPKRETLPTRNPLPVMNDKVVQNMISGTMKETALDGQIRALFNVLESPATAPIETKVFVALRYEGENIKIGRRLTSFDEAVMDSVCSYSVAYKEKYGGGPLYLTVDEIGRAINGITDANYKVSKKEKARIVASLDKMRFTHLFMDFSDEIKNSYIVIDARTDERLSDGIIDTYLIKADKVIFLTSKGREVSGYKIDEEPILLTYNKAKNHVAYISPEILNTTDTTGNEGYTTDFKFYLLKQIEKMKAGFRDNNKILFSTLYKDAGIPEPEARINRKNFSSEESYKSKVKGIAKSDRTKIESLLESWKEKKYISDYRLTRKGHAFDGVEIILDEGKKRRKIDGSHAKK